MSPDSDLRMHGLPIASYTVPAPDSRVERPPLSGLRYISLRLLWDCNIRCIMCDHPYKTQSEMAPEIAHAVLDQLDHPVRLTFIGGEPCLWLRRYPEVLRRALHM